ncbi:hypothetical protein LO763_19830 [Glycomyces sp. A-F 0318]|uniref:hypothetical protein n=1 Tax=Glycomyces amatae TaxID=2881355 RepID=UPI001E2A328B|nr:hypothetical protein [Glycomyces amatae]MCD0445863.1 hypothetical protein [Glycomyces amatae]
MQRVALRDAHTDLLGLFEEVHRSGTAVILADDTERAFAQLAPADEETAGFRTTLSDARVNFDVLAKLAGEGKGRNYVITFRRQPLVRLEALSWRGDRPEPARDATLWDIAEQAISQRLAKPRV